MWFLGAKNAQNPSNHISLASLEKEERTVSLRDAVLGNDNNIAARLIAPRRAEQEEKAQHPSGVRIKIPLTLQMKCRPNGRPDAYINCFQLQWGAAPDSTGNLPSKTHDSTNLANTLFDKSARCLGILSFKTLFPDLPYATLLLGLATGEAIIKVSLAAPVSYHMFGSAPSHTSI